MAFNVKGAIEVPLAVMGSLVTEMVPTDLPEGVSPDNQDVEYVPGSVSSRRGLARVFGTPFPGLGAVTYGKSYVDPLGVIRNLYLDVNGNLWVENLSVSPGVYTQLATTTPNTFAKSVTCFGREYIAISDGLHGQEVPLQYDGTNLDRVTQDGPGAPPSVSSFVIPAVAMAVSGAPSVLTITEVDPAGEVIGPGYFTQVNIFVTSVGTANPGDLITVAGNANSALNGTYTAIAVYPGVSSGLITGSAYFPAGTVFGLGGTATIGSGTTMTRSGNTVTVTTTSAHQMQPGYQAQISGIPAAAVGGGISTIVINNENLPGLATVTTASPHGLVPGIYVSLQGIAGTSVGGGISAVSRQGQIVTVTTVSAHGLAPGAVVTLAGVSNNTFDTTVVISQVVSATVFVFLQNDVDATSTGGTVTLNWPIPDTSTPSYFEVEAAPSPTTFQVQVNYSDGSWTGGTVSYAWDGTFFVSTVLSATSFQYQQYGPNATSSTVGLVTPYGQAAPGIHQLSVAFLTRQGYITEPSPSVTFVANGGQYISVSNIPIGPANVVARILMFTGAGGAYFYYIPTPAQVNGQTVSSATQINDNTSTSALLDFSDNTLFAAVGVSVQGNNLANQIVIDSALGFGFYESRLQTYGQRNRIQNLLNMGFDGGYLPAQPNYPTGWQVNSGGGVLGTGHYGGAWVISVVPTAPLANITQSFYEDSYGAPIGTANTQYKVRAWLKVSVAAPDLTFVAAITSASTSFTAHATFSGASISTSGGWVEATFNVKTPATIPQDMLFGIFAQSATTTVTLTVDELSVIYSQTPYLETILYGSYVDNPEAFDGVSGKWGPSEDTHKVMAMGIVRDTLYLLTQEPSGRIHSTNGSGVSEPSGWQVSEVGANCGVLSAFSLTTSQADDASAGGGEEWIAWASSSGARIFGGDQPWKISQEIQPDWAAINFSAAKCIWAVNDPVARVIYFGLPIGANTSPSLIYPVNYRELDTPYQIFTASPYHPSLSGKLVATDNTRKWTRWNLAMGGGALMYRSLGDLSLVLFAGIASGNVYTLSAAKLTDDDYGQIYPYYTTYFFVNHEAEIALGLGAHRKILAYLRAQISGVGNITITPLVNNLGNPWRLTGIRSLALNPRFDLEWGGGSASGDRMALKLASSPATGTDNAFTLQKISAAMRPAAHMPVRGAAQ